MAPGLRPRGTPRAVRAVPPLTPRPRHVATRARPLVPAPHGEKAARARSTLASAAEKERAAPVTDELAEDDGRVDRKTAPSPSDELVARGTLLVVSLLWGTYGIALRAAYGGGANGAAVPTPAELTLARTVLALLTLGPTLWEYAVERQSVDSDRASETFVATSHPPPVSALRAGLEIGVWNSFGAGLQAAGLATTPAARAGFLVQFAAVLTPLFARYLFNEEVSGLAWASCCLALVGCSLITVDGDASASKPGARSGEQAQVSAATATASPPQPAAAAKDAPLAPSLSTSPVSPPQSAAPTLVPPPPAPASPSMAIADSTTASATTTTIVPTPAASTPAAFTQEIPSPTNLPAAADTAKPPPPPPPEPPVVIEQLQPDGGGIGLKLPAPPPAEALAVPPTPLDPVVDGSLVTHFPFLLSLPYETRKAIVDAIEPASRRLFDGDGIDPVDGVFDWVGDEFDELYEVVGEDLQELQDVSGIHLSSGDALIILGAAFYAVCTVRISMLSAAAPTSAAPTSPPPLDGADAGADVSDEGHIPAMRRDPSMSPSLRARRIVASKAAALSLCAVLWCTWDAAHGRAPSADWLLGTPATPLSAASDLPAYLAELVRRNGRTWLLVLYVAWGPGVLASFLQTRGQSVLSAAPSQAVLSMTPVWSALLAPPILHESGLSARGWSGATLVLAAGLLPEILRLLQKQQAADE